MLHWPLNTKIAWSLVKIKFVRQIKHLILCYEKKSVNAVQEKVAQKQKQALGRV
jgi:hypothetical protein